MPDKRFVRRRKSIPEQPSPVSSQEQARLLNDPAVATDDEHRATAEMNNSGKSNRGAAQAIRRSSGDLAEDQHVA
jgi:hypothetical protein